MKTKLILFLALLALCGSRVWAETVTWSSGGTFNESTAGNYSSGWFTVISPFNGTLNTFTINLGTGSGGGISRTDAYLAISSDLKSTTTGFSSSDFLAISTNTCGTAVSKVEMTFGEDAVLVGGVKYYFYFLTKNGDVYTTVSQRYYHDTKTNNSVMSFGNVGTTSAAYTGYAMPFSATMTLISGSYYQIKGIYPRYGEDCYIYSNSTNENKIWKTQTAPDITQSRYVWQAVVGNSGGVILKNMGSGHYISPFTATSANGSNVNYLSETDINNAVAFTLIDRVAKNYYGYLSLQTKYNNTNTWLNTYTSDNSYVGCHNANPFAGDQFFFQQVKKVSFSEDITVNGGEAVSVIFLNVNGGDVFTLPTNKLYSINNGENLTAADAVAALAVAGSADVSVTVSDNPAKDITYKLMFNGSVIASKVQYQYVDDARIAAENADLFGSVPAYCSYTTESPETIAEETEEVVYTLNWDGPFDFSQDYENAKWYYMAIYNQYAIKTEDVPYQLKTKSDAVAAYGNAIWAFVGNPYDGIKIINFASGDGMYINLTSYPSMVSDIPSPDYRLLNIGSNEWGFTLGNEDVYMGNYNYNEVNGGIRAVPASWLTYQHTSITVESVSYKNLALAYVEKYKDEHAMGQYFGLDEATYTTTKATLNAAENLSKAEYEYFMSNATTMFLTTKLPSTGYYRIKNPSRGNRYMGATTSMPMTIDDATSASTVVKLTTSDSGRTYKIAIQGKELGAPSNNAVMSFVEIGSGVLFTPEISTPSVVGLKNSTTYIHACAYNYNPAYAIIGYSKSPSQDDGSGWKVEDATSITLTLNAVGDKTYGTTYLPFDVTLPAQGDVCAYTLTDNGNGWLRLNLLGTDGKSIPAGTPVLLRGTSTTSVTATIADVDDIDTEGNVLSGTYFTMEHGDNLVLGKIDDAVGFYKYDFDIKPNKAFIPAGTGVKALKLMLDDDDDATAIDNVNANVNDNNAAIYNIAGQRLNKMQKGINIVNGRKVVIK